MHARVILSNHVRRLYAVHLAITGKISVIEIIGEVPLRTGDVIRGRLAEPATGVTCTVRDDEELEVRVIKTGISPLAAHFCLEGLDQCGTAMNGVPGDEID